MNLSSMGGFAELAHTGIRVTVVCPAAVASNIRASSGLKGPTTPEANGAAKTIPASKALPRPKPRLSLFAGSKKISRVRRKRRRVHGEVLSSEPGNCSSHNCQENASIASGLIGVLQEQQRKPKRVFN